MTYHDEAIKSLKTINPHSISEFEKIYADGVKKIKNSQYIFRLISPNEAAIWDRIAPVKGGRISRSEISSLFAGGGAYEYKWFSFDRPYLFNRQTINQPGGREGQGMLLVIPLEWEMKNTLIKKMLPDVTLAGLPSDMRWRSCRCKLEGGVVTLGIPTPVLEQIATNIKIEHLGARITPPMRQ